MINILTERGSNVKFGTPSKLFIPFLQLDASLRVSKEQ